MAHRQRAEQYAMQLSEANKRALQFESTIADLEDRLTQATTASNPGGGANDQIAELRRELEAAQQEARDLGAANAALSADVKEAKIACKIATARAQQAQADRLPAELKQGLTENIIKNNRRSVDQLESELKTAEDSTAAQRLMVSLPVPSLQDRRLDQKLQKATKEREEARKDLKAVRRELFTAEDGRSAIRRHYTTLKRQAAKDAKKLTDLQDSCQRLETELELEKQRRVDAENRTGSDGQRCRKCDPEVVDLMGEE